MSRTLFFAVSAAVMLVLSGCTAERLPAEDLEVPVVCADIIKVLQDPSLAPNSRQKYDAARALVKKVDLTFTRETKTINEIFFHRDAMIDFPDRPDRTITFNYQYRDSYIRFQFRTYRNFVLRVDISEK